MLFFGSSQRSVLVSAFHSYSRGRFVTAQKSLLRKNGATSSHRSVSLTSTHEGVGVGLYDNNKNNKNNNNDNNKATSPLVVCGPSGVGKGTVIQKYMEEFGGSDHFGFTVSHTTRDPRPGEVHGVHYHFVGKYYMKYSIQRGQFLEHAEVHGNYYGTSRQALEDVVQQHGKRCILDIDVQGVKRLKELEQLETSSSSSSSSSSSLQPKYIFIAPPSLETLQQRLVDRGTETAESLERRTANAQAEMEYGLEEGNFDCIVVNDDLEQACQDFDKAIRSFYDDLA
eukprot:CAMPEP_0195284792 /NCGR_PEP_ID=MMETSP0707-20130614/2873_1 /TAXON_ID=33640 /ORGANISM="Asterionellopsis glacialis, Strain CCMP134" /LENGTH=282 /DNA_ID=CAMNT_0040344189 /DNA_START=150 /DNA_END=998 /DNA_ORIENTATION=-